MLKARTVDLDRLEALAFGDDAGHDPLGELAQLTPLDAERCEALAQGLGEAMDARHRLAATDAATSDRVAGLLRMAIEHHRHEGDGACPACGVGTLDHGWRTEAEREADQLERAASALQDAERRLTAARQEALVVFVQPPSALSAQIDAIDGADINRDQRAVRNRWEEWIDPPADGWTDVDIVARLRDVADMNIVIDGIRAVAAETVAAQEADWRPLARQLSAWVVAARDAAEATARAKRVGVVEDFYKDAEATIRAERFQPIADRSAQLWAGLRQQSNVNLERVALEGRTTQRRVELDVTVDGTATSALGVMSQGELHALALALFLPRVTAGESPFRFLVVDDPVQAMDPARVDGLARVLESVAVERQVIVFTHDDRLPASCRRLGVRAEIIEISRQPGSRVTASVAAGPAEKAIGDAYALATTERLPDSLKRQIVPIHCRRALEAQVQDLVWRQLLAAGRGHDEIDELITDADTTADLIALLLFGEQRPPDEVYGRLDLLRSGAGSQVRFLNRAVHEAPGDLRPEVLTGTIRNLIATLRDSAQGESARGESARGNSVA